MASKENVKKNGFFDKVRRYFRDMRAELKKIVWPSKKTVKNNTAVVIATVALSAVIIGGFDTILTVLVNLIFRGA